jgi:hypothetical protein
MKAFKIIVSSFIIICFSSIPLSSIKRHMDEFDTEFSEKARQVRNLFEDISTVNLLNGLYLSTDQMKKILALAKKAQTIKEKFLGEKASLYMNTLDEAEKAYKNLYNEIMKGDPAREGGEIEKEAVMINHRLKNMQDNAVRNITNELSVLDHELSNILTPEQTQVIDTFKPCLIPPKDLKNPVRAGQASSNDRAIQILRRVRDIPDYIWNHRKYRIISHMVERFSRHRYVMTEKEKEKELERLLSLFDKVRSMSDTDFEFEKETLAEELKPADRIHELREEIQKREPYQRRTNASKAVRFLLNKRIIPILEEKIARAM